MSDRSEQIPELAEFFMKKLEASQYDALIEQLESCAAETFDACLRAMAAF